MDHLQDWGSPTALTERVREILTGPKLTALLNVTDLPWKPEELALQVRRKRWQNGLNDQANMTLKQMTDTVASHTAPETLQEYTFAEVSTAPDFDPRCWASYGEFVDRELARQTDAELQPSVIGAATSAEQGEDVAGPVVLAMLK